MVNPLKLKKSVFGGARGAALSIVGRRASDAPAPVDGPGMQSRFVEADQAAVVEQLLAFHPDMPHALAAAGVNQLRNRVVDRLLGQP
jgi:hypothetical protein